MGQTIQSFQTQWLKNFNWRFLQSKPDLIETLRTPDARIDDPIAPIPGPHPMY